MALMERPPAFERLPELDESRFVMPPAPQRHARKRGLGPAEAFRIAIQGLTTNKLRSFLTMLGIIIGVASVIVMVSLGQGVAAATEASIRRMGTNVLYVMPDSQRSGGVSMGVGTGRSLTIEDAEALEARGRLLKAVAPEYRDGGVTVKHGSRNTRTTVYGSTPEYFTIKDLPIAQGRLFTPAEMKQRARVAVIGDEVRVALFGDRTPVGKTIRINGQNFEVVGVTVKRGASGSRSRDDQVTLPLGTAMRRLFGAERLSAINIQAVSEEKLREAEDEAYSILRKMHRLREKDPPDIRIFNQADLLQGADEQSTFLTMLLAGIALVSLVVGGIGIMNIMLVTVTERTREIGIRKAVGAKRKDILYQFLIESVTLSLTGGGVGVALGIGVALWMAMSTDDGGLGFPMLLSTPPILISFSFSALVGIFFGIYPAMQASALDPIHALRKE